VVRGFDLDINKPLKKQYDFSIVIVTLNAGKSISKCLESLSNQSFQNFEIINIDGCSTDNTQEIISKFSHLKITTVIEPDDGLYFAMNKGIAMASGGIIGIINADDYYLPKTLQIVYNYFASNVGVEGVAGSIYLAGKKILEPDLSKLGIEMIPHPALFIEKKCYTKYGNFDTRYKVASDYELVMRFNKSGVKILEVPELLAVMAPGGFSSQHVLRSIIETSILQRKYNGWSFIYTIFKIMRYLAGTLLRRLKLK